MKFSQSPGFSHFPSERVPNHENFTQNVHMPLRGGALRAPRFWDWLGKGHPLPLLNVICKFPREAGRKIFIQKPWKSGKNQQKTMKIKENTLLFAYFWLKPMEMDRRPIWFQWF